MEIEEKKDSKEAKKIMIYKEETEISKFVKRRSKIKRKQESYVAREAQMITVREREREREIIRLEGQDGRSQGAEGGRKEGRERGR